MLTQIQFFKQGPAAYIKEGRDPNKGSTKQ